MRSLLLIGMALFAVPVAGAATQAPAHTTQFTLSLDAAGHDPGGPEQIARGAELLSLGPDDHLALYDPIGQNIVVISEAHAVNTFAVPGATDIAWTKDGDLLVLHDPTRTISQWTAQGALVDRRPLPEIAPLGGQLVVEDTDVRVADVFGNHHRIASLHTGGLSTPNGSALVPQQNRVRWDQANRTLSYDDVQLRLEDAVTASGQAIGKGWLVVDVVTSSSPITVTRTAHHPETGHIIELPCENRAWVPNRDVAADDTGRLVYLDPRSDGLHIVEVVP